MNNKPFDLQKALAGEPVVTRQNEKAEYIGTINNVKIGTHHLFKVFFLDADSDLPSEGCYFFNDKGEGYADKQLLTCATHVDLFMAPVKKTVWVNMWYCNSGVIMSSPEPFATEVLALDRDIVKRDYYIGTYPIEIEL